MEEYNNRNQNQTENNADGWESAASADSGSQTNQNQYQSSQSHNGQAYSSQYNNSQYGSQYHNGQYNNSQYNSGQYNGQYNNGQYNNGQGYGNTGNNGQYYGNQNYGNGYNGPARRLYKSSTNKMISGVCAGIAEYFGWDPTVVRLIWIGASILLGAGFLGLVAYFIVAVVMPEA